MSWKQETVEPTDRCMRRGLGETRMTGKRAVKGQERKREAAAVAEGEGRVVPINTILIS